jgi:predicted dithiol-disulfide oxidoreductase (DUF899 family)
MPDSAVIPTPRRNNQVVSREAWLKARKDLLAQEKALTHHRDEVTTARLALPRVRVDEDYVFETPAGRQTLADLFAGRSQLLVYHVMFGPDWDAGCPGCSFLVDNFDGTLPHLNHHDVTLVAVSRAPLAKIEAYKRRMGWHFPWVSSYGSDFNHDYHVSFTKDELAKGSVLYNFTETPAKDANDELPGLSAFQKDADGSIYHTYSTYGRGGEELLTAMFLLDMAPLGRNERSIMDFVKRHDEYEEAKTAQSCCA